MSESRADRDSWFSENMRPDEGKLRAWLRARFPSLIDLDDVVQEAYLRLFRAGREGKIRQSKPYLYSTARNLALDQCRHQQALPMERMTEATVPLLDEGLGTADTVSRDEELSLLAGAIRALPDRCREVLVLRKLHGLSQKEIAQKLGISENTVAAQASAGVRRCIEYFREREVRR